MPAHIADLRAQADAARLRFESAVPARFPGLTHFHWYRACAALAGENTRRNDDTAQDAALAADPEIRAAYDAYIRAIHAYYRARDGERGFLGARGL